MKVACELQGVQFISSVDAACNKIVPLFHIHVYIFILRKRTHSGKR